jgi:hypothetical protein
MMYIIYMDLIITSVPIWIIDNESKIQRLARTCYHFWQLAVAFDDYIPSSNHLNDNDVDDDNNKAKQEKEGIDNAISATTVSTILPTLSLSSPSSDSNGERGSGWAHYKLANYLISGKSLQH